MSDQPPELTGRRLGHFRVDGVIGRGGMSTLYRATDVRLGRRVALKVIDSALAADPEFRERFHDEARNTSAIDHAHVVPLYDFDETDGHLYIAMRFVEGPDLASIIGGRPLSPGRAVRLLGQVGDALDAVHARGLVHLDVKPANVLVTTRESADGEHAYLADFGLTRRGATGHRTSGGDFLGSPTYAAPEHLRGEPVDARTDVYSLTCVLFCALSGRAPYLGSVAEVIEGHLGGSIPSVSSLARIDPRLDGVVRRGLDPDPPRRFADAGSVVEAARAALAPGSARPPDRGHRPAAPPNGRPHRAAPTPGEGATTVVAAATTVAGANTVSGAASGVTPTSGATTASEDTPATGLPAGRADLAAPRTPGQGPAGPPHHPRPEAAGPPTGGQRVARAGPPGPAPTARSADRAGPLTRSSVAPPVRLRDPVPPSRDGQFSRGPGVPVGVWVALAVGIALVVLVLVLVL